MERELLERSGRAVSGEVVEEFDENDENSDENDENSNERNYIIFRNQVLLGIEVSSDR